MKRMLAPEKERSNLLETRNRGAFHRGAQIIKGRSSVSSQLTEEELAASMPSEMLQHKTPIPTQIVSSDEFYPDPQNERQRAVFERSNSEQLAQQ
jgi:hypothetical protein